MNRDLFSASGGGVVDATTDPYFNSTTLLLSGDGTNGAQNNTFVDSSVNNATITRAGTPTQGSFSPFSQTGWSGYFGGSADYLTVPYGVWPASSTSWTLEGWFNFSNTSATKGILGIPDLIDFNYSGTNIVFSYRSTGPAWFTNSTAYSFTIGQWYHIAVVLTSGSLRLYINGSAIGTPTTGIGTGAYGSGATSMYIGAWDQYPFGAADFFFNGYISNIRVSNIAVYTGNFTPPTAPLTATQVAGTNIAAITGTATSLLALQDNRFKDNALTPNTITVSGAPSVQAFSPFAPTAAYSVPAAAAGSAYFKGTSNYLIAPASALWDFGSGAFTIECWVYNTASTGADQFVVYHGWAGGGALNYGWRIVILNSTNQLSFYGNGTITTFTDLVVSPNAWTHIAFVGSGGILSVYKNGIKSVTTPTYTAIVDRPSATLGIGGFNNESENVPGRLWFGGYISNLRIVKGTAVYTGNFAPPGTPLSKIQSAGTNIAALSGTETSLLTLQDSTFKDNSTNVVTITASSPAPVIQSFTPFTQVWGGLFNGSSYLTIPSNTGFQFPTGTDFTVECWVNFNSVSGGTSQQILSPWGGNSGWQLYWQGANKKFTWYANASSLITGTMVPVANTWYHVAISRQNGVIKSFVNGILDYSVADTANYAQTSPLYIGVETASTGYFSGYISNVRIVKGTAVYTTTSTTVGTVVFTPPAKTLSATQAAGTNISAIYPGQTSLLTLQDPTFKDNAAISNTITAVGTPKMQLISSLPFTSSATVDPVNGAGYFDGSSYISVPDSTAFTMGSGDFTLEAWVYLTTSGVSRVIIGTCDAAGGAGSMSYVLGVNASNNATLAIGYAGALYTSTNTVTVPTNQWVHIAGVRNGGGIYAYLNGVQSTSNTSMASLAITDSTQVVAIGRNGAYNGEYLTGYISNARITKGIAVYTTNFQPPTAPLTAITGTSLLTLQDTTFIDNSTNAAVITAGGTPVMRAFTPFASNWGGYFDGASNLQLPSSSTIAFGTGDFTVECWVNFATNNGTYNPFVRYDGSGTFDFGYDYSVAQLKYNGSAAILTVSQTFTLGVWYHVSLTRASGSSRLFVNGTQVGSTATGDTNNYGFGAFKVGGSSYSASHAMSGYISNVRIVKDTAVYTTNFQPPSAPLTKTQTASGNIAAISTAVPTVDVLVVAGGGGGGSLGGGGGAGGYRTSTGYSISPGSPITITVGSGGAGSTYTTTGTNGTNSVFGSITSTGGGGGGSWGAGPGVAGGSGGGAAGITTSYPGGAASPAGQGNKGGDAIGTGTAGGGGAGAAGGDAVNIGSNGGVGLSTNISGTLTYYAGGGGGGQYNNQHGAGTGGTGGGGNGDSTNTGGNPGTANTGGGGGGGSYSNSFFPGGAGGSGIVIVRHADTYPTATTTGTVTVTTSGGYKSYSFTTSGTITFTEPTSLLTLQNNTFIDNSSNAATITAVGAPKTQLLQLPFTSSITKVAAPWNISVTAPLATVGGSMYFTGSPDYLSAPSNTAFQFGTGEFTVECWVNKPAAQNSTIIDTRASQTAVPWGFFVDASNFPYFYDGTVYTSTVAIVNNSWNHIVVVRTSGVLKIFVNGVQGYSASNAVSLNATGAATIGGTAAYFIGYISNLRITKGTVVYTGNFTPPTAPPQPTQTPGLLGTNVNAIDGTNTSLLLLGSNAGIYDATAKNDIVTVGNAQVSSTQIKYGTGAMYFDGTGDYLYIPTSSNQNLGNTWTVECWYYSVSRASTYPCIISISDGTYANTIVLFDKHQGASTKFSFTVGTGVLYSGTTNVADATWYHIALVSNNGAVTMYINGTSEITQNVTAGSVSKAVYIGANFDYASYSTYLNGYLDDLRITKGVARYTANFTPPTKVMIGQ